MFSVKLISITKPLIKIDDKKLTPEGLMAYCARVSSPHQENPNYKDLLHYCLKNKHWSIFETVDMTVEIITTRAIAPQILRHRSFCFQEFSQRYAKVSEFKIYDARRQDTKNRQHSYDNLNEETKKWFKETQNEIFKQNYKLYEKALSKGIAKECARNLLPLGTQTRLYMKGSVRSWIHYLEVRCDPTTQKEHRDIAIAIKKIFKREFPHITEALNW
jgi:thymidylate synthase (FAD)